MRIYLAAPIHQPEDVVENEEILKYLRARGYDVWSPQEAGIATEEAKRTGELVDVVRQRYMIKDLTAMQECDICVAFLGRKRPFSEGMLWEMGWFTGQHKPVILCNPCMNKITLMAQFTVDYTVYRFDELVKILENQLHV